MSEERWCKQLSGEEIKKLEKIGWRIIGVYQKVFFMNFQRADFLHSGNLS